MALQFTVGSGNVFADLGLPDPETRLAKADLAIEINREVEARGLSRADILRLTGLDGAGYEEVERGRLDGYTLEHLGRILAGVRS